MTLTDFLLARITEDEAAARAATTGTLASSLSVWEAEDRPGVFELLIDPTRVLTECEAKQGIVDAWIGGVLGSGTGPFHVLRLLALPYADHPDYDPEWRP